MAARSDSRVGRIVCRQPNSFGARIMRKLVVLCAALFAVVLSSARPVLAQTVAWVAPNGNDVNSCSQTTPCATFAGAAGKAGVAEINCLGSGSYGPLLITKSLIIDCGAGNTGEVSASSNNAIGIDT